MNELLNFIEYEKCVKKEVRGGTTMYDIHGHYKWLTISELFAYWKNEINYQ